MPKISAIVFDIDGTLLNSKGCLSDGNLSALRECDQKGITLYIATARPKRLVFRPEEVQGDVTFLSERGAFYNGAVAIDRSLDYYRHWPLASELVYAITKYLIDVAPGLQIAIQNEDDCHSFRLPMDAIALKRWGFSHEELLPFSEARRGPCSKIVAWHETQNLENVYHDLHNRYGDEVNIFLTDFGRWLQLTSREATKEHALKDLLSLRGIPSGEVAVFGDDLPDLGMFRAFGCSIAMGNSSQALKERATYVTRTNDKDGVAFALERFLGII